MFKTQKNQLESLSNEFQTSTPYDQSQQITMMTGMFKEILQRNANNFIEMSITSANQSAADKFHLNLDSIKIQSQGSQNNQRSAFQIKLEEESNLINQFNKQLQQVGRDQQKLLKENIKLRNQNMKVNSQFEIQRFTSERLIEQCKQKQTQVEKKYEKKSNELENVKKQLQPMEIKIKQFQSQLANQKNSNQKLIKQIQQFENSKIKAEGESKKMHLQFSNSLNRLSSKLSDTLKKYNPNWKASNNRETETQIAQMIQTLDSEITKKTELSKAKEEQIKKLANNFYQSNKSLKNQLNQSNASQLSQNQCINNSKLDKNFLPTLEEQLKTNDEYAQKISVEYIETIKFFTQTIETVVQSWKSHSNSLERIIQQKMEEVKASQEQIKCLKIQAKQFKKNLQKNSNEINQKQKEIESLKLKISEVEQKLKEEMTKFKNLSSMNQKSQRECKQMEEKLKTANKSIVQQDGRISKLTDQITSLNKQNQQANKRSTMQNSDKDTQIKRLASELSKQKTNLCNAKTDHKNEVQRLKRQFENKILQIRNNHREEIKKLQNQVTVGREEISTFEKIMRESGYEIQSLKNKVSHLIKQIEDVKKSGSSFLCESDILCRNIKSDQQNINFIKASIQRYKGRTIIGSRTLARKAHRLNYHSFIDDIPNIMVIVKLITGRIVVGFSEHPFTEERFGGSKKGGGILMNVNEQKTYYLKSQEGYKGIQYDKHFIIWGNSELRMKCFSQEFYSNFGINQSNYNSEKDQVNNFLGGSNNEREIPPEHLEFVQILFEGIPSTHTSRQWYSEVL